MIKRSAEVFMEKKLPFGTEFERNKKVLGSNTMPSKKIRNQLAGYLVALNKRG